MLTQLQQVSTQLRQVSTHLLVDLEWAMCWSLESLLLASLVLHFASEALAPLVTQRRDLDVVKYENRMNKMPNPGYKFILKLPFRSNILKNSSSRIVFLLKSRVPSITLNCCHVGRATSWQLRGPL